MTPNSGQSKKEKTRLLAAKDFHGGLPGSAPLEPSPPVHLHRSPPPPGLSQPPLLSLSGSRARNPFHTSVIQSTGLAAAAKPLALIAQSRRDVSPKHSPQHRTSSPKTTSATTKPLTSSPQPLPLSLCSSPKPLSVPSPPNPLPLSSSPKPPPLTPSLKAQSQASSQKSLDALTSRKFLESSLAQVTADYRLKQVSRQSATVWQEKCETVHPSSPYINPAFPSRPVSTFSFSRKANQLKQILHSLCPYLLSQFRIIAFRVLLVFRTCLSLLTSLFEKVRVTERENVRGRENYLCVCVCVCLWVCWRQTCREKDRKDSSIFLSVGLASLLCGFSW